MTGESTATNRIRVAADGVLERWRDGAETPIRLVPRGDGRFGLAGRPRDHIRFHGEGEAAAFSVYAAGLFADTYWRASPSR